MEVILALEKAIGTRIPEELRQQLINPTITLIPKQNRFMRIVDEHFKQENSFENFIPLDHMLIGWEHMIDEIDFLETSLLPFGETLGSAVICIGIGKENYGEIYIFDYDFYATKVANSLTEFIQQIY